MSVQQTLTDATAPTAETVAVPETVWHRTSIEGHYHEPVWEGLCSCGIAPINLVEVPKDRAREDETLSPAPCCDAQEGDGL